MNAERLNDIYRNIHIAEKSDIDSIRQLTVDYPFYHLPYVVLAKYYYDTSHYKFEDMLRQAAMRVKDRKELYHYIHGGKTQEIKSGVNDFLVDEEPVAAVRAEDPAIADVPVIELMPEAERIEPEEPEIPYLEAPETITQTGEFSEKAPEPEAWLEAIAEPEVSDPYAEADEALMPETDQELAPVQEEKADITEFLQDFEDTQDERGEEEKPLEFVFEGRHESIDLREIEVDRDLIGEEIATEFSFSRSFVPQTEPEEPETTEEPAVLKEENEEPASEKISEPGEIIPDAEPEETFAGHEHHTAQDLRKNPVYTIETLVSENQGSSIEEDLSPEKDFFAWLQHPKYIRKEQEPPAEAPVEESDRKFDLIDRFININPQISRPKKEFFNPENMAKRSEVVDLEYVTETLANIYKEQGNLDLAIRAYEKLSLQNPSKQAYFASLIENIKKEKK